MPLKTKKDRKIKDKVIEKRLKTDSICPCGKEVEGHKCRFCGATKTINNVSGNVMWMRNGRLVGAFRDEKDAYIKMALKWNIPKKDWPKKFRGD